MDTEREEAMAIARKWIVAYQQVDPDGTRAGLDALKCGAFDAVHWILRRLSDTHRIEITLPDSPLMRELLGLDER